MPLALMVLAGVAGLVPARWNSGDPNSLDRLASGVVNCILVEPQNWNPAFLQSARRRRITTFGLIHPGQDAVDQARRAGQLKLDGLALEGDYDSAVRQQIRSAAGAVNVVELPSRGGMRLDSGDPVIVTWQGLWPGIEIEH